MSRLDLAEAAPLSPLVVFRKDGPHPRRRSGLQVQPLQKGRPALFLDDDLVGTRRQEYGPRNRRGSMHSAIDEHLCAGRVALDLKVRDPRAQRNQDALGFLARSRRGILGFGKEALEGLQGLWIARQAAKGLAQIEEEFRTGELLVRLLELIERSLEVALLVEVHAEGA